MWNLAPGLKRLNVEILCEPVHDTTKGTNQFWLGTKKSSRKKAIIRNTRLVVSRDEDFNCPRRFSGDFKSVRESAVIRGCDLMVKEITEALNQPLMGQPLMGHHHLRIKRSNSRLTEEFDVARLLV